MSNERSHSAVRNLRSIFENKAVDSASPTRGRSPNSDKENNRPRSKIRASFVAVEPSGRIMAEEAGMPELKPAESSGVRREGFSESVAIAGGAEELKNETVANETMRREQDSTVSETVPESGVESMVSTPLVEVVKALGTKEDLPPENPDKPVGGAAEQPRDMKPANPTSKEAVSGDDALLAQAEGLEPSTGAGEADTAAPASTSKLGKPSSISTKVIPKAPASTVKPPASQPKTLQSANLSVTTKTESPKVPVKKSSRISLVAPTAASVARAAAASEKTTPASLGVYSPPSKPKAKDVTKPLDISSRLTAPTAASRARHEQASPLAPAPNATEKTSIPFRPKPTSSARPTPRSSLTGGARPDSGSLLGGFRKQAPPPAEGFLERMTRPTAASQNRVQERAETKSPQRPVSKLAAAIKPKTNGHTKKPRPSNAKVADLDTTTIEKSVIEESDEVAEDAPVEAPVEGDKEELKEEFLEEDEPKPEGKAITSTTFDPALEATPKIEEQAGSETPLGQQTNGDDGAKLETTPAFADETIR